MTIEEWGDSDISDAERLRFGGPLPCDELLQLFPLTEIGLHLFLEILRFIASKSGFT